MNKDVDWDCSRITYIVSLHEAELRSEHCKRAGILLQAWPCRLVQTRDYERWGSQGSEGHRKTCHAGVIRGGFMGNSHWLIYPGSVYYFLRLFWILWKIWKVGHGVSELWLAGGCCSVPLLRILMKGGCLVWIWQSFRLALRRPTDNHGKKVACSVSCGVLSALRSYIFNERGVEASFSLCSKWHMITR